LTAVNAREIAANLERAAQSIQAAKDLTGEGYHDFAASRAYYAETLLARYQQTSENSVATSILYRGNKMRPEEVKEQINGLNLSEKLLLVVDIWDSIAAGSPEIPMPAWQKRELDRRYCDYRQGTVELHDWQAVHESVRKKYC